MAKQRCVICGKMCEESEMIDEYCKQCYYEIAEDDGKD
jgi:NMD protein affecting ribosome stability and mRNA decay